MTRERWRRGEASVPRAFTATLSHPSAVGVPKRRARGVPGAMANTVLLLLVLYVAIYGLRYVVLGQWAWIPMLAASFEMRPRAISLHALGGSVALISGWLQLRPLLRRRWPRVHRGVGWLYVAASLIGGGAGIWLAAHSLGGWVTHVGFGLLGVGAVGASLTTAVLAVRGDQAGHRRWAIRSYALWLSAVTLRLELPLLFAAFGREMGYALVSWMCWAPNVAVAEWLLRRRVRPG